MEREGKGWRGDFGSASSAGGEGEGEGDWDDDASPPFGGHDHVKRKR